MKNPHGTLRPLASSDWEALVVDDQDKVTLRRKVDPPARLNLNMIAAVIWSLCDGDRTVTDIEDILANKYPQHARDIRNAIRPTLRQFLRCGAVTIPDCADILYIGSGQSSNLIEQVDLSKYYVVALNNAWRHFEGTELDCWIHSGDFPSEWRPTDRTKIIREVTHPEYENNVIELVTSLDGVENISSPPHYVGYTIFFQGLYFLANEFRPSKISLLGFDHDYNPEKLKAWNEVGQPNPQNNFKRAQGESIKENLDKLFEGKEPDSFYGHGTPDPLRLGESHLREKFELAQRIFLKLGIDLVNLSPVESKINTIKKERSDAVIGSDT